MKKKVPLLFDDDDNFLEEQKLSEDQEKLRDLIYTRLDIFQQMNDKFHEKAIKCRRVLHMDDPDQDDEATIANNGKKTLQLQTLKSTINNVVADQMLAMPEAKLLPETSDMQEAADDLQDLVHYVVYCANDFETVQYRRCEDFYTTGTSVIQVAWDQDMAYGRGDIALIRWPLEAFLWDPTAENLQDCRAVMKVSWHPLSWYREHYPEEGKYVTSDENSHNNVGKTNDEDHQNDEKRAMLIEYWWRTYDATKKRYSINVAYAAGNALLDVQENVYDHGLFPFVIDVHDSIEGHLPGDGLVSELTPMMQYINRYAAYADMNARMSSKGRMLVNRSAGIDRDALTDWTVDVIEGDRIVQGESWNWMQNQPFNSTITNLMTMFQSDLKADSGANQFTRGETTGGIVSGKAINSLIQAGGKVASMRTEQLKLGFKNMVEQIIWLMSQFYDDKRTVMITGREGRKQIEVDTKKLFGTKKGTISPPPYTVQIEVSSRDPQRIANQNQMFMEAYTMSAQAQQFFPLSSLFEILNLDGKDRILPVIRANEHYQEQMQALQQQVEQMGQQLESIQEENQSLRREATDSNNTLARIAAMRGSKVIPQAGGGPTKIAQEGTAPDTVSAIVDSNRNMLGQQTGMPLPT